MPADLVVFRGSAQPFEANIAVAVYLIGYNIFQSVGVTALTHSWS
jgi:hypothetical protein